MTNGVLLLARLMMAACFVPAAFAHAANVSGLAFGLTAKGIPYASIVAAAMAVTEVFGPVLLVLGVAPRVTAGALVAATVLSAGLLHRFWDMVGPLREAEQAIFVSQLGLAGGLLLYAVTGPGALSWQALWRPSSAGGKPARKPATARNAKPRPARARAGASATA
jgi:putative oxidoreductase